MTMPLHRDFDQPRPNPLSPYQCGFSEIGVRCIPGPTPDGQCCQSSHQPCDHEQDACQGCPNSSKCSIAEQKQCSTQHAKNYRACIPTKSHWYSRNILALNLAILAGGILLVCMALPSRERFFVPGTLSRSHSQILENTLISDRCSLCHPSTHPSAESATQEQLCMKCHKSHMPDAIHGSPHDLSADQFVNLVSLRAALGTNQKSNAASSSPAPELTSTKCAHCHTEHHGTGFDLNAITDARCQSCHAEQFKSFSSNHPEFRLFPRSVPRRIAFDHRAHMEKHYAQKNSEFDCKSCHELAPENPAKIRRTASFENACAKCHQEPLRSTTMDGWAMLQLPSLNDADLKAMAGELNNWPAGALYGYDGRITLPMRLLLAADPKVASALKLFPDGDLSKTLSRDPRQQTAVREIARALKQLIRETAELGHESWKSRLQSVATQALQRSPNDSEQQLIRAMVAGLPPDLFGQIESIWFAGNKGVALQETTRLTAMLVSTQESLLDDPTGSKDEDADALLRGSSTQGLIYKNQVSGTPNNGTPNNGQTTKSVPSNLPPQNVQPKTSPVTPQPSASATTNKSTTTQPNKTLSWTLGATDEPELSDDELLKLPSSNPNSKQRSNNNDPNNGHQNGSIVQRNAKDSGTGNAGKLTATAVVGEGGWYLDSKLFTVKYMPSGHADHVLAAWIQFATLIDTTQTNSAQREAWHSPTWKPGSEAVGGCTQCHLLSNNSPRVSPDDWRARHADTAKSFTKFSHKPHATLAVTADCKHCHPFNSNQKQRFSDIEKSSANVLTRFVYQQTAQQHFHEEFHPIEKSQCAACHREGGANQGCTQCHNYHIGTTGFESSLSTLNSGIGVSRPVLR